MRNLIDPFLYNVPHLDIHGYDRFGATAVVKNFIDNNSRMIRVKGIRGQGMKSKIMSEHKNAQHKTLNSYFNWSINSKLNFLVIKGKRKV